MAINPLAPELQKFIVQYISNIEQLEILRIFVNEPDRTWSETEIFKKIQSSPQSVSDNLLHFSKAGILAAESDRCYRYSRKNEELLRIVENLIAIYRERPVTVIEAIYKMQTDPIWQFADAFNVRRKNHD